MLLFERLIAGVWFIYLQPKQNRMESDPDPPVWDLRVREVHRPKGRVNFPVLVAFSSLGNGRGRRSRINLKLPHAVSPFLSCFLLSFCVSVYVSAPVLVCVCVCVCVSVVKHVRVPNPPLVRLSRSAYRMLAYIIVISRSFPSCLQSSSSDGEENCSFL